MNFRNALLALGLLAASTAVHGVPFTFAQYSQITTNDTVAVTNGAGATGTIVDISDPTVNFSFLLPSLQAAGLGTQNAVFNLSGFIASPAWTMPLPGPDPFSQLIDSGTLSFTRTTAAPEGTARGARTNLLTITFTNAVLNGIAGGTSGSVLASTPESVLSFSSDFLDFDSSATLDFALALSSITGGGLGQASGSESARAFTADSTGTFSSDPRPSYVVPEPAAVGLLGLGLLSIGWRRRRLVR